MRESRHPHPHVDPRQPRDGSECGTNPPVFAWKPPAGEVRVRISGTHPPVYENASVDTGDGYRLEVAKDADFKTCVIDLAGLKDPIHLPERALKPGGYWWRWSAGTAVSEIFEFSVSVESVVLEVTDTDTWLESFSGTHPRMHLRGENLPDIRDDLESRSPEKFAALITEADEILKEVHHYPEPEMLPDRDLDYAKFWAIWYPTMWGTRRFVKGAEVLAFAYLMTGDEDYGRAACERLVSVSQWDPEGSSYLGHNDEAHMSVIWNGPLACDWVWELFSKEERGQVIEQFCRRGEITFHHMHDQGCYGINRFDSHAGREIVFLAQLAFVFHEHIPEARNWIRWLRPVLCGIWPVWAGDDGGWSEGVSYSNAYVTIMSRFASILKHGTGVDLYRRPFWKNYCRWKEWVMPPYAEWIGFGDHTERWKEGWNANANLVELIAREAGRPEFLPYIAAFRKEAAKAPPPSSERVMPATNPTLLLAPGLKAADSSDLNSETMSVVFPHAGWAAVRTGLRKGVDDIALVLRSSRFGSFSHSHANNNDFFIHVGGRIMAMPTGYYCGYGSAHHAHWVWHTKANNCVTLSDAPQLIRSMDSQGYVQSHFENNDLVYFCGNADASYRLQAERCRRHVVFVKKARFFVMIDEFLAQPGVTSSLQWNIHSWNRFEVDPDEKGFVVNRDESRLRGHFMFSHEGFVTLSEGWDPPVNLMKSASQWHNQYHLRFTPTAYAGKRNLGVVLCPGYPGHPAAEVRRERIGDAELAIIDGVKVAVNQGEAIEVEGRHTDAVAAVLVGERFYSIESQGILPDKS